jgi:hypothetical protein
MWACLSLHARSPLTTSPWPDIIVGGFIAGLPEIGAPRDPHVLAGHENGLNCGTSLPANNRLYVRP